MKIRILAAIAILFSGPCLAVAQDESPAVRPYTLAAVLPLTGEAASVGNFARRAVELAYSELPSDLKARLRIVYEDDAMDPKRSLAAFQMLSDTRDADGFLCMTSGIGHALAPLAERSKKLLIDVGASDNTFAMGKEFVFIHWVSPENEAAKMVQEIKRRGYKRLAVIAHIQQGVEAYNRVFFDLLKKEGLFDRVVLQEAVPIGINDLSSVLAKLRASRADGIFLALFSEGLSSLARRIRELGIPGDLFGAEFFEDEHVVRASNGALVGSWYVNIDDATEAFTKSYRDRYHEFPGLAAANAYDSIKLIARALSEYGPDNVKIAEFLRALKDYEGAAGRYSATGDNRFTLPAAVKIVKEDGFERVPE